MIDIGGILGSLAGEALGGRSNPLASVISGLAGTTGGSENAILRVILSVIQDQGGVASLLQLLDRNGLADQERSWVGDGPNRSVAPEEISSALGSGVVSSVASKLGVPPEAASSVIASVLPELINQITPDGSVGDQQEDIISRGIALLGRL